MRLSICRSRAAGASFVGPKLGRPYGFADYVPRPRLRESGPRWVFQLRRGRILTPLWLLAAAAGQIEGHVRACGSPWRRFRATAYLSRRRSGHRLWPVDGRYGPSRVPGAQAHTESRAVPGRWFPAGPECVAARPATVSNARRHAGSRLSSAEASDVRISTRLPAP